MNKNDEKRLDETMSRPTFVRKVSQEQTIECPIFDPFEEVWKESDEQLRTRIKKEIL